MKFFIIFFSIRGKLLVFTLLLMVFFSCNNRKTNKNIASSQFITVLGIAQDAGFPHINNPDEWNAFRKDNSKKALVVSLGLIDIELNQKWLFEATPNMPEQLHIIEQDFLKTNTIIDGVFLTHAHIGHYTGLMHFGREAMGASQIPVYAMPKMKEFLNQNGPWSQLVDLENISIRKMKEDSTIILNKYLKVTPFIVPHRDEFSETVGYKIEGKYKSALFIPDINKWELWERSIVDEVEKVDYAFIDATFFKEGEIPRPMSEVPHPFIVETIELFKDALIATKAKVVFIHFNHSNPAIKEAHPLKDSIQNLGFRFAKQGDVFGL